jgi:hypothetical protein
MMQHEVNGVEHAIGVIIMIASSATPKARYRGLAKNSNRLFVAAALSNLVVQPVCGQAPAAMPRGEVRQQQAQSSKKRHLKPANAVDNATSSAMHCAIAQRSIRMSSCSDLP